jgi:hypothetical protein
MESPSIASGLLVRPKPSTKTIDSPADLSDEASRSFKRQGDIVDLMPHPGTDPFVVETLDKFALSIGQIPIIYKKEVHGYIFNSMFGALDL